MRKIPTELYQIDPIKDPRWGSFIQQHPKASVFHSVGWLNALRSTYGYQPVAYSTSPPTSRLYDGIVLCKVESWLTGRRLVSLPFSDHCEPLCEPGDQLDFVIQQLKEATDREHLRYLEFRPIHDSFGGARVHFQPATKYFLHTVDLRPNVDELFRSLHRDCVQRRIQRADRAGLTEKVGTTEALLNDFYTLFVATRRRHCVPPSPLLWFRNLVKYLGDALEVRVAYHGDIPVASILTLGFKNAVYYKYGCSDVRFHRFGVIPWLFWRAMLASKLNGAVKFDLGRTEASNTGLLTFKNHWTSESALLLYLKFPKNSFAESVNGWKLSVAKRIFACMPDALLKFTGRVVYRHIG